MRSSLVRLAAAALVAGLVVAAPAGAQKPGKSATKSAASPATANAAAPVAPRKITTVEGITEYALGNGLRVLMVPDATKPTVTVNLTVMVGSRHEGYGETGMAHLLEHMVFKGSPRHTNVPKELSDHGAQWNGSTWYDRTNYFETVASTDQNLDWALDLEADRFVNSYISADELKKEFSVVRNEFEAGENSPFNVLLERVMSTAYLWHNYGKSTIGNKTDIEGVPADRLQVFYHKYYQPDNAMLVVAGRFDEPKALALVNRKFGSIPRPVRTLANGMALHATYTEEPTQDGERIAMLRRVGDVQVVILGYHIPAGTHPDYPAIDVLAELLGASATGRLHKALIDTRIASSTGAFAFQLREPGYLLTFAQLRKEQSMDSVRLELTRVVEDAANVGPTAEELQRAKTKLLKDIEITLNKSEDVGIGLSEWASMGDWRFEFIHRDRIQRVTAADVQRVAKAYLQYSNRTMGMFVPTAEPQRAEIPRTPDFSTLVSTYTGTATRVAGEAFDVNPAKIDARLKHATLASGLRVHLLPKQTRGGVVNAAIELRYGTEQSLMNKGATPDMAADMLTRGTATRSRADIKDAFDKLQARVNVSAAGAGVTRVSIETVRDNLVPTLKLVADVLKHPSFPADEFEKLRLENLAQLEEQKTEPTALGSIAAQRAVSPYPKGHPLYAQTIDESIDAYKTATVDQSKAFHAAFYGAKEGDVAVAGDFDAEAVSRVLTDEFGNWTAREVYARVKHTNKVIDSIAVKIETPDKQNALFVATQPIDLKSSDPEWVSMRVGSFIFGESGMSSRIGERLRQKEGLSYGAGGGVNTEMMDRAGTFNISAIYNPMNADKLVAAAREELDRVLRDGFTDDEVAKAKSAWLQARFQSRAEDRTIVGMMLLRGQYGLTFDGWDGDIERRAQKLTTAEVNATFRKYVNAKKVAWVIAGDFAGAAKKKQDATVKP